MEKEQIGGVLIDRCAGCGTLWLDAGEMERLLTIKGAAARADAGRFGDGTGITMLGATHCPRDGAELIDRPDPGQPHVLESICPRCRGVLLDCGELKDLSERTLRERVAALLRRS